MRIFNHISKDKTKSNVKGRTTRFDQIFSDYALKADLLNYYNKLTPIPTTNPIAVEGNKITSLEQPTEDRDAISRIFLNKRISTATKIYNLI